MSPVDQVADLSSALGVSLRKVTRPEVFELIRGLLDRLDVLGIGEKMEAWGYEDNDSFCEVDADGRISALLIEAQDVPHVAFQTLASLESVKLLAASKVTIGEPEARVLAGWAGLEYLVVNLDPQSADAAIAHLARLTTLRALYILNDEPLLVDLEPLRGLPNLKSLFFDKARPTHLRDLARFPALRNLAFVSANDSDRLQDLGDIGQLEKLILQDPSGDDLSFVASMRQLKALFIPREFPPELLRHLVGLQELTMEYPQPSLDALLHLTELRALELRHAALRDLSALAAFTHLEELDLSNGTIGDLSTLPSHRSLRFLNVSGNPISMPQRDFSLPQLKQLEWEAHLEHRLPDASFVGTCQALEILNLSGHALDQIEFLHPLGNLRALNLAGNYLSSVSALAELPNLEVANVAKNRLTRVAPLAANAALRRLEASANLLEDIDTLGGLARLEVLGISGTGTSDLSFVKRLKQVYALNASQNTLRQAEALLELPHLNIADLSNNQITNVSRDLCEHASLVSLVLFDNPIEEIDREIYSDRDGRATLKSLRDYYRGLSRGSVRHDQVKLVLVGNGRVGKTSVVNRLIDGTFDDTQPSTHGIQLRQWSLADVLPDKLEGAPLKINVWDFGGQDIYHATHRLFMRTRALFMLIWDQKTEEEQYSLDESGERYENFRLPYWVDYIRLLGHSPVIIVQNKVDTLQDKRPAYGVELRGTYPPPQGILDYVFVSARRDRQNGMSSLTDAIVLGLDEIESIGQKLPAQWITVRDSLLSMNRRYLEFPEFVALCESAGLRGTEPESVARFFHKAGTILYQKHEFGDRIILDQKWAIEAVYALFDRRDSAYTDLKIAGRNGLTLDLLKRKVWRHFSEDEHSLLLEFMKSCELCFELTKDVYYVPQLLPDEKPSRVSLRWKEPTDYCVQITYPFLHRAIIERFLVRTGTLGADDQPEIWKNGITIFDDASGTEAMVEAFPSENRILIQAKGNAPVELLQMIRAEFEELHNDFPATTTLSADGGTQFVELERLKRYVAAKSQLVESTTRQLVNVAPLEVFLGTATRKLTKAQTKVAAAYVHGDEIFLSYAWGDRREAGESREAIVDRLYDALMAQRFTVVRDKKDNGYGKVISDFMRRLGQGKLVVVVISDKYLKSPYCMYELLEIYEHGGFSGRIFPIVLPDASLHSFPDRLEYVRFWKREKGKIEDTIKEIGLDAFSADGSYREYDLYYRRVFNNIDKLTTLLADINSLTPELLEEDNFAALVAAIQSRAADPDGVAAGA